MAGKPKGTLSEKHYQALKLLDEGELSKKEIALQLGWTQDYFTKLCTGDITSLGQTADLFKKEYQKAEGKKDDDIKNLVKTNTRIIQSLILRTVKEFESKPKLNHDEKKLLGTLNNSMAKTTPTTSIKNLSYSYISALTPQELIYEYERLRAIAESSFNRKRIQGTGENGPGSLPEDGKSGSGLAEDS